MTPRTLEVINSLSVCQPVTAPELAYQLDTWPSTVSRILRRLVKMGLLNRSPGGHGAMNYYLNEEMTLDEVIRMGLIPTFEEAAEGCSLTFENASDHDRSDDF